MALTTVTVKNGSGAPINVLVQDDGSGNKAFAHVLSNATATAAISPATEGKQDSIISALGGTLTTVSTDTTVLDATLSLDTSIYADGEVLADTQEITSFFRTTGGSRLIQSLTVLDEDDQGVGFDLLFLDANNSIGTENSAPSVTDANARSILAKVSVSASDYIDLGGCRVACIQGIGAAIKAASGQTSVWIAAITRSGTPTYTASGIRLKIGVI